MNDAEVSPVEIPTEVDLLAVFVAGIAGSLIAARRDFDITGVIFLAVISGLGGGILRDTLIQRGTPVAFTNSSYLVVAFAAASIGFFFSQRLGSYRLDIHDVQRPVARPLHAGRRAEGP